MNGDIPVYEIHLPEYNVESEPDHEKISKKVDNLIKKKFKNQYIAVRCLSSDDHENKTVGELIEIIKKTGTDRYNPDRKGDRYENNEKKHIDFFAFDYNINPDTKIFSVFTWPFYHYEIEKAGRPLRINIIIIYDPKKLEQVEFSYPGREHEGMRSDGFVFKDRNNKQRAVKAIIKLT